MESCTLSPLPLASSDDGDARSRHGELEGFAKMNLEVVSKSSLDRLSVDPQKARGRLFVNILLLGEALTVHFLIFLRRISFAKSPPGPNEAGKSALLKQMRLAYIREFGDRERYESHQVIVSSLRTDFKVVIKKLHEDRIQYRNSRSLVRVTFATVPLSALMKCRAMNSCCWARSLPPRVRSEATRAGS